MSTQAGSHTLPVLLFPSRYWIGGRRMSWSGSLHTKFSGPQYPLLVICTCYTSVFSHGRQNVFAVAKQWKVKLIILNQVQCWYISTWLDSFHCLLRFIDPWCEIKKLPSSTYSDVIQIIIIRLNKWFWKRSSIVTNYCTICNHYGCQINLSNTPTTKWWANVFLGSLLISILILVVFLHCSVVICK